MTMALWQHILIIWLLLNMLALALAVNFSARE